VSAVLKFCLILISEVVFGSGEFEFDFWAGIGDYFCVGKWELSHGFYLPIR
jgi:hypothetical protein